MRNARLSTSRGVREEKEFVAHEREKIVQTMKYEKKDNRRPRMNTKIGEIEAVLPRLP